MSLHSFAMVSSCSHVFGLKSDVKDNCSYFDEMTVVYPAGHNTIIHNPEQKTQKFLTGTERTEEITAMAIRFFQFVSAKLFQISFVDKFSPNKKFVAVAEKSDKGIITVFDLQSLKKKRPLSAAEFVSKARPFLSL